MSKFLCLKTNNGLQIWLMTYSTQNVHLIHDV